jgi:hypothetical protein
MYPKPIIAGETSQGFSELLLFFLMSIGKMFPTSIYLPLL